MHRRIWPLPYKGSTSSSPCPARVLGVTYRKEKDLPLLMSTDPMRVDPDPPRLTFLAQAWKAAHNKARDLGWLNS